MRPILIIHSVVCLLGIVGGVLLALGSVISIADMKTPWAAQLLVAAFVVPAAFVVSGIGSWLAYHWNRRKLAVSLMAFPWVYLAAFVAAMICSFPA